MKLKILRNIFLFLSIVILSFGLGYERGKRNWGQTPFPNIRSAETDNSADYSKIDFSIFWDVWNRLARSYIFKKDLIPQKMVYGAISGMVSSLGDPYTVFLPPEQNKEAKDDLGGQFEGIGAQLGVKDKKVVVITPLKSSPAERAGIRPGDWIIKVNGVETLDWTLPQVVSEIRGPEGTSVDLTVLHPQASKSTDIKVTRETIQVASVEWETKKAKCSYDGSSDRQNKEAGTCTVQFIDNDCTDCQKVIYLRLGKFGDNTNTDWNKAISEIEKVLNQSDDSSIKGLVLDLRYNPGGYLSGSVYIVSEFLENGTVFIQENAAGTKQKFEVSRKGKLLTIPLVVLINKGSASSAEIVAGALQDRSRAKIVGETSFGKGSIQEVQELPQGAGVHITVAKWLLPSEKWINGNGIKPDVEVTNEVNGTDRDFQLEKAVEILLK